MVPIQSSKYKKVCEKWLLLGDTKKALGVILWRTEKNLYLPLKKIQSLKIYIDNRFIKWFESFDNILCIILKFTSGFATTHVVVFHWVCIARDALGEEDN